MHALEWIAEHGRFLRSISLDRLRKRLERQKGYCTWCDGIVPKGSHRWCSEACSEEGMIRGRPSWAARRVQERDKGVCDLCGIDTAEMARLMKSLRGIIREGGGCLHSPRNRQEFQRRVNALGPLPGHAGAARSRWWKNHAALCPCIGCLLDNDMRTWQADHIIPVSEGGGLCSLAGLRTLCAACHKEETRKLAKRLARPKATEPSLFAMI